MKTHRVSVSSRPRMAGLTLVELMIALALGLIISAAVGYIYIASLQTYRTQESVSRMQEGARFAFEIIGNDLRMAGLDGCGWDAAAANSRVYALNSPTDWYKDLFGQHLVGTTAAAGDTLNVLHADITKEYIVQSHNPAASPPSFTLTAAHDIEDGEILVATDCSHVAIFQVTGVDQATGVVEHDDSGSPGNTAGCYKLGDCAGAAYTYPANSRIYRLSAHQYHIADNPAGIPSLYRDALDSTGGTTDEELVEGVENIRFTYGVDSSTANDTTDGGMKTETAYLTAGAVTNWSRVTSVKISLLMRTAEDNVIDAPQSYSYDTDGDGSANAVNATDRRLRKVFEHVIKVRNR